MARLIAHGVTLGYPGATIAREVSFSVPDRAVTTIIGPNGCGKSTLIKGLARLITPLGGQVTLDGRDVGSYTHKQLAAQVSMLPQSPTAPSGITVNDLVSRGRFPHQQWWHQWSSHHDQAVATAMELTGVGHLAKRHVDTLSGGQRQRVWIAMVLAQDTDIVFLDEPTTYLDLAHSIDVLDVVHSLNREHGKTIVMVLHDLNLAARYSDHLVLMKDGAIWHEGSPEEIITHERLLGAFGLDAAVIQDPFTSGPLIVPNPGRSGTPPHPDLLR